MEEIWKAIPGYEGHYEISTSGSLRSIKFKNTRFIKLKLDKTGYYRIILYKDFKAVNFKIHKLVAITFILNPENKPFINHIDGIKTNNNVNNLEWCTPRENNLHAFKNGLSKMTFEKGKNHRGCKITQKSQAYILKKLCEGAKQTELAKELGISLKTVRNVKNNKIDYLWE